MQHFVEQAIKCIRIFRYGVEGIVHEFIHYKDSAVTDINGPFVYMLHQCSDDFLGTEDFFKVAMRFGEKFMQPCFTTNRAGEVQFMKNGEFFLSMKNGNITKRSFVYLHNERTIILNTFFRKNSLGDGELAN